MSELKKKREKLVRLKFRNILLNTTGILLCLGGIAWAVHAFWRYRHYEVTNDAFVDQYIAPLNIRVAGYIRDINFREHQRVSRGDTLLQLDDREYRIKVDEARAALLKAQGEKEVLLAAIATQKSQVSVQAANASEAQAKLWQARQEYERYARLLDEQSVSRQKFDQVKADCQAAEARYVALQKQHQATRSESEEMQRRLLTAQAAIQSCQAALDMALLNLSYTVVTAPYDGYMGRRTLEPGQLVQAGQTISNLVRGTDKWITANYLETQIAHIHIGQKVRIRVDALADRTFSGVVSAISEATGSKYALIPTDNSAGNFVKVQQRIPVRIDLQNVAPADMALLRAGMMVEVDALKD